MADLTIDDIDGQIREKVYVQDYTKSPNIEGVKIIPLKTHSSEEGDFGEIIRIASNGEIEQVPGFRLVQVNRTHLFPGSIKAWHLHFRQDEIWYLPPNRDLFVGLWDVRKNSTTRGTLMRLTLGGGKSELLFIPRGVAHGSANFTLVDANLFYLVNEKFDIKNPDEKRLPWDQAGADFWKPKRD